MPQQIGRALGVIGKGQRVRERRLALKLNQDQLCARVADVTEGAWVPDRLEVLRIERGTRGVFDVELVALAEALGCDACWLLLGEPEPPVRPSG